MPALFQTKVNPILLDITLLLARWRIEDTTPSRYAAMLHFLYLWMWDAKNPETFPRSTAMDFMDWAESEKRDLRAVCLTGCVLLALRYNENIPSCMEERLQQWTNNDVIKTELIEVQKFLLNTIFGQQLQKRMELKLKEKIEREQQIIRDKLGVAEDEEIREEITQEGERRIQHYIQKIGGMVKDGLDLNIATFATVARTDHFKTLRNWLAEFHSSRVPLGLTGKEEKTARGVLAHIEMCDLDKYAISHMFMQPPKFGIITQMLPNALLSAVEKEDETLWDKQEQENINSNAYRYAMQNFYRLFCFSPWRKDMVNPFSQAFFVSDCPTLSPLISDQFLWDIANVLIRLSLWSHPAVYLRSWMHRNGETDEALRLLALCDKHNGDTAERLRCLMELECRNPEDLKVVQETGICLIQEKRYNEALQRFFHLELSETHLHSSARAIAWCSMLSGNMERAKRYYKKLLHWEGGPSWEDFLNAGHCAWLSGNPVEASQLYRKYLALKDDDLKAWDNDESVLLSLGLEEEDISLMRETITK